jgi:antitoxin component of RelBE/YafQ-DinJ toxin-antitoxin module
MSDLFEYKGYCGTIEYSAVDDVMYGKVLGIRSLLSYEGDSVKALRKDFEDVIDEYLADCAADGLELQIPFEVCPVTPNAETLEAMREVELMEQDPSIGKGYTDVKQMKRELMSDIQIQRGGSNE